MYLHEMNQYMGVDLLQCQYPCIEHLFDVTFLDDGITLLINSEQARGEQFALEKKSVMQ